MVNCKDDCRYWTYNKTSETCYYSKILIAKHDISGPEIVTGSAHCKSNTIYFPHCAELNVNYTEVVQCLSLESLRVQFHEAKLPFSERCMTI